MDLESTGRLLLFMGLLLFLLGGAFMLMNRIPGLNNFGNLPGDIRIQGENFACFMPIVSMCLLSLLATIILNIIARLLSQ